ncbi:hypothetical protein DFH09DRAFT_1426894 [Mycena vulgaris]|nr:hypothetical protein DFH09DRAFT_1426894 [Mycena vulgaris]
MCTRTDPPKELVGFFRRISSSMRSPHAIDVERGSERRLRYKRANALSVGRNRGRRRTIRKATPGMRHHKLLTTNESPEGSEISFIQSVTLENRLPIGVSRRGNITSLAPAEAGGGRAHLAFQIHRVESGDPIATAADATQVLGEIFSWTLASSRKSAYSLSIAKLQLQRARTIKLQFHAPKTDNPDRRYQIEMFQCLAERSSSWNERRVLLTSELIPLLEGLRDSFPLLRRLWIQWNDVPEGQAEAHD